MWKDIRKRIRNSICFLFKWKSSLISILISALFLVYLNVLRSGASLVN